LKKANEHRNEWFEGVHKCKLDETLFTIMDKIVKAEVRKKRNALLTTKSHVIVKNEKKKIIANYTVLLIGQCQIAVITTSNRVLFLQRCFF
jgi:hypothetical protein